VDSLLVLGTDGAVLLALLGLLVAVEPLATAVVVLVVGLLASVFHFATRKRTAAWGLSRSELEGKKLQVLQEGFAAVKEIKAMECEDEFASRFGRLLSQSTRISRNYTVLTSLPRVWLEFLAFAGLGVLLIALTSGGNSIFQSLPELAVFTASAFRVLPTVNRLIFAVQNLQFGQAATEILLEINAPETQRISEKGETVIRGPVEFEAVTFQYPRAASPVLKEVSFQIPTGAIVGLSGESGSGKSTVACLLLGLLQPTSGQIVIGGVNVQSPVGKVIGYVPQSVYLIDDTIRRNVAFGVSHELIDDQKVLQALSQAHMLSFVSEKPEGLDYCVGEDGSRLSGGQRQRIGIARAMYSDPRILILDEATSALDTVTSEQIVNEVCSLCGTKTIIVISHDPFVLSNCDNVLHLSNATVTLTRGAGTGASQESSF
jgi:ABC-type bacteriocin/lantibiotic exporter with double-glycine peptidase domain